MCGKWQLWPELQRTLYLCITLYISCLHVYRCFMCLLQSFTFINVALEMCNMTLNALLCVDLCVELIAHQLMPATKQPPRYVCCLESEPV